MDHRLFINDHNEIELVLKGNFTPEQSREISEGILTFATAIRDQNKPVHILTDFTDVATVSPMAVVLGTKTIKDIEYDKIAGFGASPIIVKVFQPVISTAANGRIQFFASRQLAENWLRES